MSEYSYKNVNKIYVREKNGNAIHMKPRRQ